MKVSIALAAYNGAAYIQEQLESFVAQTRMPDELVICDDGSTDETIAIIEEFSRVAPFKVIVQKNPTNFGYTRNFEKTLSLCGGDVVFLSDQDDVWFPEKIETVCNLFSSHPNCLLIIHDGRLVNENLEWQGATKLGQVRAGWGSDDLFVTGALTAVRRQMLSYALPLPPNIRGHDVWLHNLGRLLDCRLVTRTPLQIIRRHSSNTSTWIASSVDQIQRRTVLIAELRSPPSRSYDDRASMNRALASRIELIKCRTDSRIAAATVESALSHLADEERAIRARNRMVGYGCLRRRLAAAALLLRGQYKHFNGWKSFARDVFR